MPEIHLRGHSIQEASLSFSMYQLSIQATDLQKTQQGPAIRTSQGPEGHQGTFKTKTDLMIQNLIFKFLFIRFNATHKLLIVLS